MGLSISFMTLGVYYFVSLSKKINYVNRRKPNKSHLQKGKRYYYTAAGCQYSIFTSVFYADYSM